MQPVGGLVGAVEVSDAASDSWLEQRVSVKAPRSEGNVLDYAALGDRLGALSWAEGMDALEADGPGEHAGCQVQVGVSAATRGRGDAWV